MGTLKSEFNRHGHRTDEQRCDDLAADVIAEVGSRDREAAAAPYVELARADAGILYAMFPPEKWTQAALGRLRTAAKNPEAKGQHIVADKARVRVPIASGAGEGRTTTADEANGMVPSPAQPIEGQQVAADKAMNRLPSAGAAGPTTRPQQAKLKRPAVHRPRNIEAAHAVGQVMGQWLFNEITSLGKRFGDCDYGEVVTLAQRDRTDWHYRALVAQRMGEGERRVVRKVFADDYRELEELRRQAEAQEQAMRDTGAVSSVPEGQPTRALVLP